MARVPPFQTTPFDNTTQHTIHPFLNRIRPIRTGKAAEAFACKTALNTVRTFTLWLAFASWLAMAPAALAAPPYKLPTMLLEGGGQQIEAEIARDETTRQQGLMHRTVMPDNHGMLFVFDRPAQYCFWMKDTLIPLSIAFLDDDGRVVDVTDMQPRDERSHCPKRPVRLALEMNRGWFAAHHVRPGTQIQKVSEAIRQP